ncbi:hypothetical protein [Hymenobacter ruber]
MKLVFLALLLLTMCAQPQPPSFRECPCTHTNPEKRLYNQVLTELIEQRFYSKYLSDSVSEMIQRQLDAQFPQGYYSIKDTATIKRYITAQQALDAVQQNRLFNDSSHFKTIYLDTSSRRGFLTKIDLPHSTPPEGGRYFAELNSLLSQIVLPDMPAAITQLNLPNNDIFPVDFQLCTAKIAFRPLTHKRPWDKQLGIISFSKPVFNATQTKALLRYDWHCGGKCGFGELLIVEKTNSAWRIKQALMLWIS